MRTGFIGLGAMGWPMASRLSQAGVLQGVFNRTRARAELFAAEHGCSAPASIAELAASSDCLVLCLPADADVLNCVADIAGSMSASGLVIDCSTVSAETARSAAATLAQQGISFLDCPVSGGTEGARNGNLAIMAGGDGEAFTRALPLLGIMGKNMTHMGPSGTGQASKAVNQVMVAGIAQTVTEALAFAVAEGLPIDKVVKTLSAGAAGNWFLAHRGESMVAGQYPLGFKVSLHRKDLEICRTMAARHGASLPMVEMTLLHYRRLMNSGHAGSDISSLFTLKQRLFEQKAAQPAIEND